jgi:hypothetical protein
MTVRSSGDIAEKKCPLWSGVATADETNAADLDCQNTSTQPIEMIASGGVSGFLRGACRFMSTLFVVVVTGR